MAERITIEVAPFANATVDDLRHAIAAAATAGNQLGRQGKEVIAIGTTQVGSRLDITIEFQTISPLAILGVNN